MNAKFKEARSASGPWSARSTRPVVVVDAQRTPLLDADKYVTAIVLHQRSPLRACRIAAGLHHFFQRPIAPPVSSHPPTCNSQCVGVKRGGWSISSTTEPAVPPCQYSVRAARQPDDNPSNPPPPKTPKHKKMHLRNHFLFFH